MAIGKLWKFFGNRREMSATITRGQAEERQMICNICHTGCLDCHYTPSEECGSHTMSRISAAINCDGGGKEHLRVP